MAIEPTAFADTRQDALTVSSQLYQAGRSQQFPEEMRSLDSALATAEAYLQVNDPENAEHYYLMAIQKARVIEAILGAASSATLPSAPSSTPTKEPDQPAAKVPFGANNTTMIIATDPVHETSNEEVVSNKIVGTASTYTIAKGDTLRLIAAKLGVSRSHLSKLNKLDAKATLKAGQILKYNNRKIIPQRMRDGIVVNIPDRTLYLFQKGKLVRSLPVALGTNTKNDKYDWQTPVGKFKVLAKAKDPTWYVPSSIQSEMEDAGKDVIVSIPPGPENPLGKYAIKTSIPGIMIHSTTKPWSIYSFASHGCIRVYPDHMEELFKEIKVSTVGEIIYKPVKLAVTEDGRVFLEVHSDFYDRKIELGAEARKLVENGKLKDRIDWKKFNSVLKAKSGIAEDISL